MEPLRYIGHELHSTQGQPPHETEARFYVTAQPSQGPAVIYGLQAMTDTGYRDWFVKRETEGLVPGERFPLVVPTAVVVNGLVPYMQQRFLNPTGIKEIQQFLDPIEQAQDF
jgi:hypothetical protein